MVVSCHQPNYLPWIGYFAKMRESDVFVLLDSVQFPRGVCKGTSWVNRNRIKTSDGELWLSVPVKKKGRGLQIIKDVEIENIHKWRENHLLSLFHFYKKAPYFNEYIKGFERIYKKRWDKLVDLNLVLITQISKWLGIKAKVVCSSSLGLNSNKSRMLIDICKKLGADTYISGIGGNKYLDLSAFSDAGITVKHYHFDSHPYPQFWGDFIPNLSIVDLLFNCGKRGFEIQNGRLL